MAALAGGRVAIFVNTVENRIRDFVEVSPIGNTVGAVPFANFLVDGLVNGLTAVADQRVEANLERESCCSPSG